MTIQKTLIKYGAAALIVIAAAVWIQYLRVENKSLQAELSLLSAINASNAVELETLRRADSEKQQIAAATETQDRDRAERKRQVAAQKEKGLLNEETFNAWAGQSLPGDVGGLLGF